MGDSAGTIKKSFTGIDASQPGVSSDTAVKAGALLGLLNVPEKFPFRRGVVVEVINDAAEFSLTLGPDGKYFEKIVNENVAHQATRNSLLLSVYDDEFGGKLLVCLPFFPSHIMMPIKVGEVVWWIAGPSYPYWFSRVASTDQVEDVNYTHLAQEMIFAVPLGDDAKVKKDKQEGLQ